MGTHRARCGRVQKDYLGDSKNPVKGLERSVMFSGNSEGPDWKPGDAVQDEGED